MRLNENVIVIELTEPYFSGEAISVLNWSNVQVLVPNEITRKMDVGSWAFRERKYIRGKKVYHVDPSSEDNKRHDLIKEFVFSLYYNHNIGKSKHSLLGEYRAISHFVDWLNENESYSIYNQVESINTYKEYSKYLKSLIDHSKLKNTTAGYNQSIVRKTFSRLFNVDEKEFSSGIPIIRKSVEPQKELKSESDYLKSYQFHTEVFTQITSFLLEEKHYPMKLKMPQESLYVFPTNQWAATKERLKTRDQWIHGFWSWNYDEGKINNIDDIFQHYKTKKQCRSVLKKSTEALENANKDMHCFWRHRLGILAHDSFAFLFCMNTGMNLSSLIDLKWENDYEIVAEHQGFRTVKNRAKGKVVEFQITNIFKSAFNLFLKLRKYLLKGQDFDYLFFSKGYQASSNSFNRLSDKFLFYLNRKIKLIDPSLPVFTMREIRAFKQDYLIGTSDVKVSADLMQHSVSSSLKYYSRGSQRSQKSELSVFYKKLNESLIIKDEQAISLKKIPIGHCDSFDSPISLVSNESAIEPDCDQPEGCLFCKHYRVHADEHDVRKLASIKYIILESQYNAESEEHFNKLYETTLNRIDSLFLSLEQLSKETKKMVREVINDVEENENLSLYWQQKLNFLSLIGSL